MKYSCTPYRVLVVLGIPVVIGLAVIDFQPTNLDNDSDTTFMNTYHSILIFLVVILFIILKVTYVKCSTAIQQHHLTLSTVSSESDAVLANAQRQRRLALIFLCMVVVYTVTFVPKLVYHTLLVTQSLGGITDTETERILSVTFDMLYFASTIINPAITMFANRDYRRTLISIIRCRN